MDDNELCKLSLLELQDLHAQLHLAIRAAIRAQQEAKAGKLPGAVAAPAKPVAAPDLARERDAWLAQRRSGATVS